MKELVLIFSLFSMVVLFLLGLDSHNRKDTEILPESEELTFHERTTNGIIMLDSNNNRYFVDYFSLENANIKIDENTKVVASLNEHGEILAIQ